MDNYVSVRRAAKQTTIKDPETMKNSFGVGGEGDKLVYSWDGVKEVLRNICFQGGRLTT